MRMRVLDHATLMSLNDSSLRAGRSQNLRSARLADKPQERYWITEVKTRDQGGRPEVRMCVVLNLFAGQTAWLDVSSNEFAAIPEIDVSDDEWETAMCAGTPPSAL